VASWEERVSAARRDAIEAKRAAQQYKEQAAAAVAQLKAEQRKSKEAQDRHLAEQVGW
jgi:hypothetical protein